MTMLELVKKYFPNCCADEVMEQVCPATLDPRWDYSSCYKKQNDGCNMCWAREVPNPEDYERLTKSEEKNMDNVQTHKCICDELNALYSQKNADYGDSFHKTFEEEGMAMARIRLSDKLSRFKRLSAVPDTQQVHGESMRDTLIDLANYAIMTVMEIDADGNKSR